MKLFTHANLKLNHFSTLIFHSIETITVTPHDRYCVSNHRKLDCLLNSVFKSPATWLFVKQFVKAANIKKTIKAVHYRTFVRQSTSDEMGTKGL